MVVSAMRTETLRKYALQQDQYRDAEILDLARDVVPDDVKREVTFLVVSHGDSPFRHTNSRLRRALAMLFEQFILICQ